MRFLQIRSAAILSIVIQILLFEVTVQAGSEDLFRSANGRAHIFPNKAPFNTLFVHFDKNIYTNNEPILFSAYILNADADAMKLASTLSVALISEQEQKIHVEGRFIILDDRAFGSIVVPDSVRSGRYRLSAIINVVGPDNRPSMRFIQPIMIRSTSKTELDARLRIAERSGFFR